MKAQLQWLKCFTGGQACPIFPSGPEGMEKDFMLFLSRVHSNLSLACDKMPLLFLYSLWMTSAPRQPVIGWRPPTIEEEGNFTN